MKSQQAAEREEQRRIKNLVLNYDLRDEQDQHDGIFSPWFPRLPVHHPLEDPPLEKNPNTKGLRLGPEHHGNTSLTRSEKSGRHHRSRRLNLSDVDWYGNKSSLPGREKLPRTDGVQK